MNSTTRFTGRADLYARYRPGYPPVVIDHLREAIGLHPRMLIADIGSGTGISAEVFLKNGNTVYGVEPNDAMRAKAELLLQDYPAFNSVNGQAEATTLEDNSMDIILASQSFHWFRQAEARREFSRIAQKDAYILLMWNMREISNPFSAAYENIFATYGTNYSDDGRDVTAESKTISFFAPCPFEKVIFSSTQELTYEVVRGRLLSTSFMPSEEDDICEEMLAVLKENFDRYAENGKVKLDYTTTLYMAKAH
ncbi:class I SAM-dependent methyltransferase [Chitinophaga sp. Mgbs1]|uniref:Class I SAM-dependent methyltransferase n=1 Tax=Chitinophaga solisilvae TaxID=1233460 RepID=A0A3S1BHE8_9BACT|nr:class I SAM-dependent methyltransferase [Chitinophaga solisilvae]